MSLFGGDWGIGIRGKYFTLYLIPYSLYLSLQHQPPNPETISLLKSLCYNLKRELSNFEVNIYGVKVKRGIERYLELPEGYPAELLKGEIVMVPSPSRYHQEVALEIVSAIYKVVKEKDLGKVFYEFDVHLDDKNVVRPDIVFISKERESMIKDHWVEGVPDLIVEIVSSASKTRDFIVKRELYEKNGVRNTGSSIQRQKR